MMSHSETQLIAERDKHEAWLKQQNGMNGAGIGLSQGGGLCIKIFTNHMAASVKDAIRARFAGVPVEFEEIGELRAF